MFFLSQQVTDIKEEHFEDSWQEYSGENNNSACMTNHDANPNLATAPDLLSRPHNVYLSYLSHAHNYHSQISAREHDEMESNIPGHTYIPGHIHSTRSGDITASRKQEELGFSNFQVRLLTEGFRELDYSRNSRSYQREALDIRIANASINQPSVPAMVLDNLDLYRKMMLQQSFPEYFSSVSQCSSAFRPIPHPSLQQIQQSMNVDSQSIPASSRHDLNPVPGIANSLQGSPVRPLPTTDFQWSRSFLPYHHQLRLVPAADPALLPYSSMMLPRPNRAS